MKMYDAEVLIPGQTKWRKFKNITGDGFLEDKPDIKFLILEDGTHAHLPYKTAIIWSPGRELDEKSKAQAELSQPIQWSDNK